MRPKSHTNHQEDLFKSRLSNQLNPKHELFQLSGLIPWDELETEFATIFDDKKAVGRPASPVRLIVGLLLLQHMHNLSDERVVRMWVENAYWQYFCGYDHLQWQLPIDPSSLTRWRNRLGSARIEKLLSMSVSVAVSTGVVTKQELQEVIVDTTVMPKNIEFPTDTKLLEKARVKLVKLAKKHGLNLRQNYNLVSKKSLRKISGYLHARQMKRAKKEIKHFKTLVGRVSRDCERKIQDNELLQQEFGEILSQTNHLLTRKPSDKNKLYSLHEPSVSCISKGKSHKKYEFGSKVSLSMTHKKGVSIVTSALSFSNNPYDGHTLEQALKSSAKITGVSPVNAFVDRGYKGHNVTDCNVYISGQKRGITAKIKKQLKPHIGHLKNDGKIGLCRLKAIVGDQINAVLCAASYNLKQVLYHLRALLLKVFGLLFFIKFMFLKN
jgi:IS5 family transposase